MVLDKNIIIFYHVFQEIGVQTNLSKIESMIWNESTDGTYRGVIIKTQYLKLVNAEYFKSLRISYNKNNIVFFGGGGCFVFFIRSHLKSIRTVVLVTERKYGK